VGRIGDLTNIFLYITVLNRFDFYYQLIQNV